MVRQSFQLLVLMLAHITGDLFGGLLGAILPALCVQFTLSLPKALALITLLGMSCNIFQVVAGHVKAGENKPWMISAGLLLAALIPLIGFCPPDTPFVLLALLMIAGGAGVAWIHPNGLRGIHELHRIPSSVSTSLFMVGGFAGFASGAWISGTLVERIGLTGLAWLIPLGIGCAILVPLSGIRLASDGSAPAEVKADPRVPSVPFGVLMVLGTLATLSAVILTSLLPTRLHELDFPLSFGGKTVFLFGLGGAFGSLFWGAFAHKRGYGKALRLSLSMGIPPLALYLILLHHPLAVWLLLIASFFLYAAYPLIVTLSRYAPSRFNLGQRMGLIVGGCWGMAAIILMGLGPLIEKTGISPILHLTWISYSLILVWIVRRKVFQN